MSTGRRRVVSPPRSHGRRAHVVCRRQSTNTTLIGLLWILLLLFGLTSYSASANTVADQVIHDIAEGAEKVKHTVQETIHSGNEFLHHELDILVHNSALAGNVWPVVQKLIITPDKAKLIVTKIAQVVHWQDLVLIVFLGWFTVPLLKLTTESLAVNKNVEGYPTTKQTFYDSVPYHVANALSQVAKLAIVVYGVDILKIFLTCMGFTFPHLQEFPHNFAKVLYILWLVQGICKWKSQWIASKVVAQQENDASAMGRAKVVDRLLDAAILGVTTMVIFDILSFQLGFAGKSVFAIGSVGTLVVSLASQGIVTQILNGLLLASSDRIYEGDQVKFGNGIEGKIEKLGWMETILRGSDEIMVSVPNADLAGERVSNLSRLQKSQVKQTLRFQYKDADRLPLVVKDIKREIEAACPEAITDGSRPFRVHFTSYGPDFLEVRVNVHFDIKPVGDAYWENRQRVLMAIRKAVKQHDMEFAMTQG